MLYAFEGDGEMLVRPSFIHAINPNDALESGVST